GGNLVRLWDIPGGKDEGELRGHTGIVTALCFRADGKKLATAARDGTVWLWDVAARTGKSAFKQDISEIRLLACSTDDRIAAALEDRSIRVWDAGTGRFLWQTWVTDSVHALSFDADGKKVVLLKAWADSGVIAFGGL